MSGELLEVTGSCLVIASYLKLSGHGESYWKLFGDWELLEVVWSIGVTGSCLVMESYWKLSFTGNWSWRVTGSCLVIGSYWKFSGYWELLGVVL